MKISYANGSSVGLFIQSIRITVAAISLATMSSFSKRGREEGELFVFLDIDGVLNSFPSRHTAMRHEDEEAITLALAAAPTFLDNLDSVIKQSGALIVLSSTWRIGDETKDAVVRRLASCGLELFGCTPELEVDAAIDISPEEERAIEIAKWLDKYRSDGGCTAGWVAIDDMDLVGNGNGRMQSSNFVMTLDDFGLTRAKTEEAVAKLLAQRPEEGSPRARLLAARAVAAGRSASGDGSSASGSNTISGSGGSSSSGGDGGDELGDDDRCLCSTARFELRTPSAARDDAVHALFNDAQTMLPHLPMLCPITREAMASRRTSHRDGLKNGASAFMDMVDKASGELIGTCGFREFSTDGTSAEYGIVVRKSWQRTGVCQESFRAIVTYARDVLKCDSISAATQEANAPMRAFLDRVGLKLVRTQQSHGLEWLVHEAKIDELKS